MITFISVLMLVAVFVAAIFYPRRPAQGDWQVIQEGGRGSDVEIVVQTGLSAEAARTCAVNRTLRSKVQHRAELMFEGRRS